MGDKVKIMTYIEVVIGGNIYRCPDEPAALRLLRAFQRCGERDEVRLVRTSDGTYQARWSANTFLM